MRRPHFLKPNHRNEQPQAAIWVDTETKPVMTDVLEDRHVLWFGWAAFRRRGRKGKWGRPQWLRFTTRAEWWDWLDAKIRHHSKMYLFAHNVDFDAPVLGAFTELPARGWELDGAIIEGPPTILTWKWRGVHWRRPWKAGTWRLRRPWLKSVRTLVWIDTLNLWRMPLKTIGESIGLAKLTMPSPDASAQDWDAYGKRDVEVIMAACLRWWAWLREHDLGGFAPTLAGQAFRAYRHRFMSKGILIDANESALELARQALHGGRTECHRIGFVQGPVHVLDINAMYPDIMRRHRVPMYLRGIYGHVSHQDMTKWLLLDCVVADVEIETDVPIYGVVHEDRLCFPVGVFRVTLTTPELRFAHAQGHIRKIHRAAVYIGGVIFKDYVEFFTRLRDVAKVQENRMDELCAKTMGNSLFGKFGQRGRRFEGIGECPEHIALKWTHVDLQAKTSTNMRALGGLVQSWVADGEAMDSHPSIAAHITAYGRVELWELNRLAGAGNVFYNDTDSLHVNDAGLERLKGHINPTRLGALKLEGTHPSAEYRGPKDYSLGATSKTKGVRSSAGWVSPDTAYQTQFTSLKGLIQRGDLDAPFTSLQTKTLKRAYQKGVVQPNGLVLPLRLDHGGK